MTPQTMSCLQAANWLKARVAGDLSCDSRKVAKGDGFVAWPGAAHDGRRFVAPALEAGAVAALVELDGIDAFELDPTQVVAVKGLKACAGEVGAVFYDHPSRQLDMIAVTGTNGKTSTSRIAESLVRAHGLRTGLFTSPHLERFTERVMIDGEPIDDGLVADAWDEISPFVDLVDAELAAAGDAPLTFFELLTVLAFVAFADAPVDVAVIEVGMGGSWDSTNTADGDVVVFAPIDLDHADRLGNTIAEIATVKSGIIKPGAAAVSAEQNPAALEVLKAAADARSA